MNPVKAGMATYPEHYKWSSFKEYVREGKVTDFYYALNILSSDKEKARDLLLVHNAIDSAEVAKRKTWLVYQAIRKAYRN